MNYIDNAIYIVFAIFPYFLWPIVVVSIFQIYKVNE